MTGDERKKDWIEWWLKRSRELANKWLRIDREERERQITEDNTDD